MAPDDRDDHPLLRVLLAAAGGAFPPVDGVAELLPALPGGLSAVVCLTGRAYLATGLSRADLAGLPLDGFGGATQPEVLRRLAGPTGTVGVLDATLVARGTGGGTLPRRDDLDDHPRVRHALALRADVRVHGDDRGLVTLSSGLAGRLELSVETVKNRQGQGAGRTLLLDALALAPVGAPVFAAVSPGNARSLRALLAVGFVPLGSEVVIVPEGREVRSVP